MDTVKLASGLALPFPVETPFAMRPNLRPWQQGDPITIRDLEFERYIAHKKADYCPVFADSPDLGLLERAVALLQAYDPGCAVCEGSDDLVRALTMSLQEDWVLMAPNSHGELSAQILSVHCPSGWDPREKAGMAFAQLHEPVADNELIQRAASHLARTIAAKGPFIRHVWAIASTGGLSRRPDLIRDETDPDILRLWYRCERQTTIPIDGKAALFLIRVFVAPLVQIFQDPHRKRAIIDSINSMSEAVLDYKGYRRLKVYLGSLSVGSQSSRAQMDKI